MGVGVGVVGRGSTISEKVKAVSSGVPCREVHTYSPLSLSTELGIVRVAPDIMASVGISPPETRLREGEGGREREGREGGERGRGERERGREGGRGKREGGRRERDGGGEIE